MNTVQLALPGAFRCIPVHSGVVAPSRAGTGLISLAAGREQFEQWMERRRQEETDPGAHKALWRGWCLGSSLFKREMLLRVESGLGEHHSGELRQGCAEAKAGQIVALLCGLTCFAKGV